MNMDKAMKTHKRRGRKENRRGRGENQPTDEYEYRKSTLLFSAASAAFLCALCVNVFS